MGAFAERYELHVETVSAAEENEFFPLPRSLRPDAAEGSRMASLHRRRRRRPRGIPERLRHRRAALLQGHRRGRREFNFLLHTSKGAFILTLYEKRVAVDDLPYFLSLMAHLAERGVRCPQPARNCKGEVYSELAGRPAAIINFLEGVWPGGPTRRIAPAWARRSRRCIWRGAIFRCSARTRCRSKAGGRCSISPRHGPTRRARPARLHRARARPPRIAPAERPAARRHPCRPVSGQRVLPRR